MPDVFGRLLPEDYTKINAWWASHWEVPVVCPVCKSQTWTTIPHLVITHRHAADGLFGSPAYTFVVMTCTTCGHSLFFSAVMMGLIERHVGQQGSGIGLPQIR